MNAGQDQTVEVRPRYQVCVGHGCWEDVPGEVVVIENLDGSISCHTDGGRSTFNHGAWRPVSVVPVGHPARLARIETPEATIRHLRAVIAALTNDVAAAKAENAVNEHLMSLAADHRDSGHALAEFRLKKVADITLDLIGQLLVIDAWIEKNIKGAP